MKEVNQVFIFIETVCGYLCHNHGIQVPTTHQLLCLTFMGSNRTEDFSTFTVDGGDSLLRENAVNFS